MLAADRVTLDAHTARYRLAARGGGSHPTHEGMRSFPRTAPRGDIIADRLGGQNRWPLTPGAPHRELDQMDACTMISLESTGRTYFHVRRVKPAASISRMTSPTSTWNRPPIWRA